MSKNFFYGIISLFNCFTVYASPIVLDTRAALDAHNQVRMKLNAGWYENQPKPIPPLALMRWDDSLASAAQHHAQNCLWQHSNNRLNSGENMYAGTFSNFNIHSAVKAWADERHFYNYSNNSCAINKQCGHYTQLAWDSSTKVGCAARHCSSLTSSDNSKIMDNALLIVCQYSPAGNYENQRPYTHRRTTSDYSQYNSGSKMVHIPHIKVFYPDQSTVSFSADLKELDDDHFQLTSYKRLGNPSENNKDSLDLNTNQLYLPAIIVDAGNNQQLYSALLEYIQNSDPMIFKLISSAEHKQ